ncbi:hypothetical protein COCSUDRAFT_68176 [Coccomyxa subellipsoidea C-169]|uniref:Uncharacterized protein n=1 Tax=Coccomyxa subellipsoidea (strain C-169) TaxID=574566 RepID=I0YK14_COCSC|nr:hypothetical protein COCSUDRAFT_68176 [Coccomyxa subellipsoidea C-169]EIE18733.1 hypothetical protein COCSUDRAFT_68176 [Coccomyxa subellipsoidea C-169]|eukprot:XP_005643277.1 hypothetical protein COCSUDRAFT_68176 [Coccomyxa subellipsoidea C-169]
MPVETPEGLRSQVLSMASSDPSFDPSLVTPSTAFSASPSTQAPADEAGEKQHTASPSRPAADEPASTAGSGSSSSRPAKSGSTAKGDGGLKGFGLQLLGSSQTRLFILHSALLLLGLGVVQPLSGLLSYRAWRWFLAISVLSHGYKLSLKHGRPTLRPFPAALKAWFVPVATSTDFQYLLLSFMFLQTRPMTLVVVPIWVLALYHFFAYASQHFSSNPLWVKYGADAHRFLSANQGQALVFNAGAEIGAGLLLLLGLLTPARSIMLTFIYWRNFLPARYNTPDSSAYHRQAWGMLAERAAPVLRAVPMLQVPISYIKRGFAAR